jgi:hypothetical protein
MGLFDPLIDAVVPHLPADRFPTSAKLLLKTLQGDKSQVTNSSFTPEELAIISRLIEIAGDKGYVGYGDYMKLGQQMKAQGKLPMSVQPSLFSMGDALGNIQTTLGRFSYKPNAKGSFDVTDTYDFNPVDKTTQVEGGAGLGGPYGVIREYAGAKIPPGKGRSVFVNVGRDSTWEPPLFPDTTR